MPKCEEKKKLSYRSIGELNKISEDVKVNINGAFQCKQYCKAANDIYRKADLLFKGCDEEQAYMLFMRYFFIVQCIKKTYEYSKSKNVYLTLLKECNAAAAITKAEELSTSLRSRYEKEEIERKRINVATNRAKRVIQNGVSDVANGDVDNDFVLPDVPDKVVAKGSKVPQVNVADSSKPNATVQQNIDNNLTDISNFQDNQVNAHFPRKGFISVTELYSLFKTFAKNPDAILIVDIRPSDEFAESTIRHACLINIPDSLLQHGANINSIERKLSKQTWEVWSTRFNKKYVIIIDFDSDENIEGNSAIILQDVLCKFQGTYQVLIVAGGFRKWILHYPSVTTNPHYVKKSDHSLTITNPNLLKDLTYPELPSSGTDRDKANLLDADPSLTFTTPILNTGNTPQKTKAATVTSVDKLAELQKLLSQVSNNEGEDIIVSTNNAENLITDGSVKKTITKSSEIGITPESSSSNFSLPTTVPKMKNISNTPNFINSSSSDAYLSNTNDLNVRGMSNSMQIKTSTMTPSVMNENSPSPAPSDQSFSTAPNHEKMPLIGIQSEKTVVSDISASNVINSTLSNPIVSFPPSITYVASPILNDNKPDIPPSKVNNMVGNKSTINMQKPVSSVTHTAISSSEEDSQHPAMIPSSSLQQIPTTSSKSAELNAIAKNVVPSISAPNLSFDDRNIPSSSNLANNLIPAGMTKPQGSPNFHFHSPENLPISSQLLPNQQSVTLPSNVSNLTPLATNQKSDVQSNTSQLSQLSPNQQSVNHSNDIPQSSLKKALPQPGNNSPIDSGDFAQKQKVAGPHPSTRTTTQVSQVATSQIPQATGTETKLSNQNSNKKSDKSKKELTTTYGLPYGWEKAVSHETGRIYYKDHNTHKTYWTLPPEILSQVREKEKNIAEQRRNVKQPAASKHPLPAEESRPSMKRSLSSPNLAELVDADFQNAIKKDVAAKPIIDRSAKPKEQKQVLVDRSKKPISASRLQHLSPVYGSMGALLTGLKNLGNTCYMNSVVQCLSNTAPLGKYFTSGLYEKDLNSHNMNSRPGEIARELSFLIIVLSAGQYRSVSPLDFKHALGRFSSQFSGSMQQDAHELLMFLLDGLHEDINKVRTRQTIKDKDNSALSDSAAADTAWANYLLNNNSIIVDLFQGQFRSTVVCLSCGHKSKTFDAFNCLQLEIPSNRSSTLESCIFSFTKPEKIGGNDSWKCSKCKCYREASKTIEVWKLPPVMIIQLKRFHCDGRWRNKIQSTINYPLKNLNMDTHVVSPDKTFSNYHLYAIINHYGSFESGHYTAYSQNPFSGKWYCYDDNLVKQLDNGSIETNAAYLLFYTAVDFKDCMKERSNDSTK